VIAWSEEHSPVPLFSGNGFFAEDGGMLAIATSPFEQGEVAARLALEIALRGRKPAELPVVRSHQFIVTMRDSRMRARRFELPFVYEAAARVGDKFFP
jgi:hypothetical protein